MNHSYAQTNLQLYRQMESQGYTADDLVSLRKAHDLAMRLTAAAFRGSGKPLLAHLVGTASILVSQRQPVDIVAAGLLHAAYALGDFGDGRYGITAAKRERVRRAVGERVEDLVNRYTTFDWNKRTIPMIRDRVGGLSAFEREVLVIRLANELEDHLDYGVLYCGNGEKRREYIRSPLNQSVEMARQIGLGQLAEELERAFQATLAADVPVALRTPNDYTYVQPPESLVPKAKVAARQFLDHRPRLARAIHPLASLVGLRG